MALAILEPIVGSGEVRRFRGHIGANRYWGYVIGAEIQRRRGRGSFVADARHRSRLFGPLPDIAHGRVQLEVPARLFDRDNRRIQLFSFRTRDLVGPSWSDVLTVAPASVREVGGGFPDGLPPLTQEFAMTLTTQLSSDDAENVALEYVEAPLAQAQFLGVIGNLLPSILPMAGQLLGAIGGGGGGGGNGKGGGLGALGALFENEDFQKKVMEIIGQLTSTKTTAKGLAYGSADVRRAVARAQSTHELPGGYAEAQVAPALLAALPALMPVLEKMMNPETIKAITDGVSPTKLTGMVIDGMKDFAKLGIASHEQDLKHLRELNPGVEDKALDALLASMSLAVSTRDHEPQWRRLRSVKLAFADVSAEPVHGRDKVMYALAGDVGFPLTVELPDRKGKPRVIPKAALSLAIKDPATRKVLAGRRFELEKVQSGDLPLVPSLRGDRLSALKPGEDYLVTATLTFERRRRDGRHERVGTSRSLLITAVGEAIFDRVEGNRGLVPLNDAERHRPFWHKLWQRTFERDVRRVTWATRYVYALEPEREKNGRLQTLTRVDEERVRHEVGKLKSGMALSPRVLNELLGTLEGHRKLTDDELRALASSELVERFQQAARGRIEIDADPGKSAALWLWPEVKLTEIVLRVPGAPDRHGRVRTMEERKVVFPIPAMVHLVAVRTGETDGDEGSIGGMKIVEDKKVALYPTQVVQAPEKDAETSKRRQVA